MAGIEDRVTALLDEHGYVAVKRVKHGYGSSNTILAQHKSAKVGSDYCIVKAIDACHADDTARAHLLEDADALCKVRHPFIVKHSECLVEESWYLLVSDCCRGGNLAAYIKETNQQHRYLPESQVTKWFAQLCLAIKHIHNSGLLHRDLNPRNVFMSRDSNIRVSNFGLAKLVEGSSDISQIELSSLHYSSPEFLSGKLYDRPCDVWSAGCILYEMCALHVPFDAVDAQQLRIKIAESQPPELRHEFSKELRDLCKNLLESNAAIRPETVEILKKPVVRSVVKAMLDNAVQDADRYNTGRYREGETVEYYSSTHGYWLLAKIIGMRADGSIMLNVKPNMWLPEAVQDMKVRSITSSPGSPESCKGEANMPRRSVAGIVARGYREQTELEIASIESSSPTLTRASSMQGRTLELKDCASIEERRSRFAECLAIGGKDGAKHLHATLSARYWGVTRAEFVDFLDKIRGACLKNESSKPEFYYDDRKFLNLGPNIHQVNEQFLKPQTDGTAMPIPWVSYALLQNPAQGVECDVFISHAWDEGLFEFSEIVLEAWPEDSGGAYICFLANPQNLDIENLISSPRNSPFFQVISSVPKKMLMIANSNCPIHSRLWCCYEAFCAAEVNQSLAPQDGDGCCKDVLDLTPDECAICVEIAGNPLHLIEEGPYRDEAEQILKELHAANRKLLRSTSVDLALSLERARVKGTTLISKICLDVANARCSSESDAKHISQEISGQEELINFMIKKHMYDAFGFGTGD